MKWIKSIPPTLISFKKLNSNLKVTIPASYLYSVYRQIRHIITLVLLPFSTVLFFNFLVLIYL